MISKVSLIHKDNLFYLLCVIYNFSSQKNFQVTNNSKNNFIYKLIYFKWSSIKFKYMRNHL